ncbi:MAG TPA: cation:proton antiporter [Kofleriaceae bacterium]|nr:cation:proton antiporter [Kofleriaceae bacterium]
MTAAQILLYRVVPFGACLGVLAFARWSGLGVAGIGPQSTTIALGFLLVSAFLGGAASARIGLPRITGFLVVGLLAGPYVTSLLTHDMLEAGKAVEGVAVALIALTAGGEIKIEWLRKHAARLAIITGLQILIVATMVGCVVFFGRSLFPFIPADDLLSAAIIALVLAAIAVSNSPTVTIALISDNKAKGPLSQTVLGVVVLVDVCVIVLFAVTLAVARDALGSGPGTSLAVTLARELGGSVLVGVGFGIGIAAFLRYIGRDTPVFILGVCFAIAQLAAAFHLEALLIALTAGLWVGNVSRTATEPLIEGIERLSLPIYAVFFASAGAKVNLDALASMWPLALLLSATRAIAIWAGAAAGTRLARTEPVIQRYAWLGLISQAGVTLALAAILARAFPEWGEGIQVLIVAMIALHEIIGPIGFQFALRRAGEVGKALAR